MKIIYRMCIYIYVYIYTHMHVYIYIYIKINITIQKTRIKWCLIICEALFNLSNLIFFLLLCIPLGMASYFLRKCVVRANVFGRTG